MDIRFTPNPAFEAELAADPATHGAMVSFGRTALAGAQAAAPVRTGRYRDSLELLDDGEQVALISTSSLWGLIEYGSVNNSPSAPLRRGVEAAGLPFSDTGG
jgi:hypothetical protein